MARKDTDDGQVHSITSAAPSRRAEQSGRVASYLWQMALRVVCFLGALVAFLALHWPWLGWTLVAAAAVLPNTAVIVANATARRRIDQVDGVTMPDPPRGRSPRALRR